MLKAARLSDLARQAFDARKTVSAYSADGDWLAAASPLITASGTPVGVVEAQVPTGGLQELKAHLDNLRWWLVLGAIAGALFAGWACFRTLKDLHTVERQLDEYLAQGGGLERRLAVDNEKATAGVVEGFNRVMDRFQQMVSSVKRGADLVSNSSQRVSLTAGEVSRMAGEVSITIQQVAKGTEEQSSRTAELNNVIQLVADSASRATAARPKRPPAPAKGRLRSPRPSIRWPRTPPARWSASRATSRPPPDHLHPG